VEVGHYLQAAALLLLRGVILVCLFILVVMYAKILSFLLVRLAGASASAAVATLLILITILTVLIIK